MAEAAGLVIGGVGLLGLFDSCMNAFEYVESGRHYGRAYEQAALDISVLQLRLQRWARPIKFVEDASVGQYSVKVASEAEAKKVAKLLGYINLDFEAAQKAAERYERDDSESPEPQNPGEIETIERLTSKVKALALKRQKKASMKQKTLWALHDKRKMGGLVEDLNKNITSLVELFPSTKQFQQIAAQQDVSELVPVQPSEIEEPEDNQASASDVLKDASSKVDSMLQQALQAVSRRQVHHAYNRTNAYDDSQAEYGDYVAKGSKKSGRLGNDYNDVSLYGRARARYGDNYDGPSVFGGRKGVFDD